MEFVKATDDPLINVLEPLKFRADKEGREINVPWLAINNAFSSSGALNSPAINDQAIAKRLADPADLLNQWLNTNGISSSGTGFKITPANAPTDLVNNQEVETQIDKNHENVRASAYRQLDRDRK
jgi:hypothetical protein